MFGGRGEIPDGNPLVLAFVVVAVIELTRTYVDARRIASSVDAANTHLVPVQVNTAQVQRLDTTAAVTEQIDKATASLEGKTRKIEQSVSNIQAGAASVQNTVVAINSKVDGITSTARTISTTASALAGTVNDIHNIAASIHDSARGINTSFATLFPVTQMIAYGPRFEQHRGHRSGDRSPRGVDLPQHPGHGPALWPAGRTRNTSTDLPAGGGCGRGYRNPVTACDPVKGRSQLGEVGVRQRLQHHHVHRRSTEQEVMRVYPEAGAAGLTDRVQVVVTRQPA
ncbi:MAG TPA: hypothetical protein VF003_16770 [Pseudonocardiaceae bacterium]